MPHTIKIKVTHHGEMTLELYPEMAPKTVQNFLDLIEKKFYDGLTFHRVILGFMIQGGCPQGTGMGGPGYQITGEFKINGVNNPLKHERGVISMARAQNPNSAGSQFFIMHQSSPHLDGQYAAFGKVIEGFETIDAIASVKTGPNDQPIDRVIIESITIF
jgi:peptidyl-prolyl cis-trans isomerase B (cyclophilin B)